MSIHNLNTAVMDAMGIPWKGQNISRVTIKLGGHDKLPVALIERVYPRFEAGAHLDFTWERLELRPAAEKPAPGIDIDALCTQATARLQAAIEKSAAAAVLDLKTEILKARIRLQLPLHKEHLEGIPWVNTQRWSQFQMINEYKSRFVCMSYPTEGAAS